MVNKSVNSLKPPRPPAELMAKSIKKREAPPSLPAIKSEKTEPKKKAWLFSKKPDSLKAKEDELKKRENEFNSIRDAVKKEVKEKEAILKKEASAVGREKLDWEARKTKLSKEVEKLKAEKILATKELHDTEGRIRKEIHDGKIKEIQIQQQIRELEKKKKHIDNRSQELDDLHQKLNQKKEAIETKEEEHLDRHEVLTGVQKKLENTKEMLEKKHWELQRQDKETSKRLEAANMKISDLKKDRDDLEKEIAIQKQSLADMKKSQKEQIDNLSKATKQVEADKRMLEDKEDKAMANELENTNRKKSLDSREKEFSQKKAEIQQKINDTTMKLEQRENELSIKDKDMQKRLNTLDKTVSNLEERRTRLEQDISEKQKQLNMIVQTNRLELNKISTERKENERLKVWVQKQQQDILAREGRIKERVQQVDDREKDFTQMKQKIASGIKQIEEKQRMFDKREKEVLRIEDYWAKQEEVIKRRVLDLDEKKKTLDDEITNRRAELAQMVAETDTKEAELENLKKTLEEKEDEIVKKVIEMEKDKKMLDSKSDELYKEIKEFTDNKKILEKEEKRVTEKLKDFKKKEEMLKRSSDIVTEGKKTFEESFIAKKSLLDQIQTQWDMKQKELETITNVIKEENKNVMPKIEEAARDLKELDIKEREVAKLVTKMEREITTIHKREGSVKSREEGVRKAQLALESDRKEFEANEKRVVMTLESLERQKSKLSKVKDLKTNLPALEKRWTILAKSIEAGEAKLMAVTKEVTKKEGRFQGIAQELERKQQELMHKAKELEEKEMTMSRREYDIARTKWTAEDDRFKSYMEEELEKRGTREPQDDIVVIPKRQAYNQYIDVEKLVERARDLVREGHVDDAKKMLEQVESAYGSQHMSDSEKKKLGYDILELKTDVKLAELR